MHRSKQLTSDVTARAGATALRSRAMRELCSSASLAVALVLFGGAHQARAQSNPQQLAEANRTAMEAYNNLDVEQAKASLEKSARSAEKAGIRGPALARTFSNLAVVLVGGMGDQKGATAAFVRALKEDPKVEPDPIVATPEVMAAFNAARAEASRSGAAPVESTAKPSATKPLAAPRDQSVPIEGNLEHVPVTEQLTQTAIPVFVKKSSDLEIASLKIFYRALGMKKPKTAELEETDDGYTYLIPCTDVFEPVVEYFLVASDDDDKQIGNSGTPEAPIAVPVVTVRSTGAPSLPGQVPPTQCSADDECPPGMPGCSGSAGMGATCSSDSDCQSGLICSDDFCSAGERSEGEETSDRTSSRANKRFFFDLSFGVAATYVGEGRAPDRSPRSVLNAVAQVARDNDMLSTTTAEEELRARGWDCEAYPAPENELGARNCTVAVKTTGFVAVPILNVAAGYYVTPRIALALTGRFQLSRGDGPLAGIMLGARGEYLFTTPTERGLRISGLAGLAIGQMQARPPPPDSTKKQGPFATNAGAGGGGAAFQLGARAGYRFIPNFGVTFTPMMNFGIPSFLFGLDLPVGVELAF
jgi:hypothetical protein